MKLKDIINEIKSAHFNCNGKNLKNSYMMIILIKDLFEFQQDRKQIWITKIKITVK